MIASLDDASEEEIAAKMVPLAKKTQHQKVIVFDLDETLAHTTVNGTAEE